MVPQLPPETINQIIQLSLPRPSFDSFRERPRLLLSYALVNRTWRPLAQQELFKHVTIGSAKAARDFVATLEEGGAAVQGKGQVSATGEAGMEQEL